MNFNIPGMGAAPDKLALNAVTWWSVTAAQNDIDLTGFDPNASMDERISWAVDNGFDIGTTYSRVASGQKSLTEQVRECIQWASRNQIYVPPEFISVDGEMTGHRNHRDGFNRMKTIIDRRLATVLVVTDLNRLYRTASRAMQVVNHLIADTDCRAVCVTEAIDSDDRLRWQIFSLIASELFYRENRIR